MPANQGGTRHAFYLAFVSAAARGPGFLVPLVIATAFGAGPQTDAYFLVYSAVLLVGGTLGQGVEVAVVPFAARVLRETGGGLHGYLRRAAWEATTVAGVVWAVAVVALTLGAPPAVRTDVGRYAVTFAPLALLWCASGVYSGALISQWEIASASGSMLWRGAGALLGLSMWPVGGGLGAVAAGLGLGEISRLWWLHRGFVRRIPPPAINVVPLAPLRKAAAAQVLAGAAGSLVPVVERVLAGTLGAGTISHLEYATRLLVIPTLFFDGGLGPLLLARWSNQLADPTRVPTWREIARPVAKGLLLAAACALPLVLFAPQFVSLVLRHGKFTSDDVEAVASLLRVLAVGFVASMGALLLERFYLAGVRNRTLAALSLVRAGSRVALVLAFLASRRLLAFGIGYAGAETTYLMSLIALATVQSRPQPLGREVGA